MSVRSRSNWNLDWSVSFWGERENGSTRSKTSRRPGENQQKNQPKYGFDVGIWSRGLIGGRRVLSSLRHPYSLAPFRCLRDPVILTNLDTILFSWSTQHRYPYKAFRHVSVIPSVFPSFSILQSVFTFQPATSLKIARIFPISLMERIVNLHAEKNNSECNSQSFDFILFFSYILYILLALKSLLFFKSQNNLLVELLEFLIKS